MGIICEASFGGVTTRSCRRRQEFSVGNSWEHSKVDNFSGAVEDCTAESCLTSDFEGAAAAAAAADCRTGIETVQAVSPANNDSCAGSSGGSSSSWTWQSNSIDDNVLEQGQSKASSPSSSSAAVPNAQGAPENWQGIGRGGELSLTSGNGIETLPPLVSAGFPLEDQHKARLSFWDSRPKFPSPQTDFSCLMQQEGSAFGSRSHGFKAPQFFDTFFQLREDNLGHQPMLLDRYQQQQPHQQHQQQEFNTSSDAFYHSAAAFNSHNGDAADGNHKSNLDLFLGSSTLDFKQPISQHITNHGAFGSSHQPVSGVSMDCQFGAAKIHKADGQLLQQSIVLPGQSIPDKSGTKSVEEMPRLQEANRDAKRHRGSSTSQKTKSGTTSKRGGSHKREPALNTNLKPRAKQGCANDPQSIAARQRRERISDRLKILQELIPNGSKVDLVTMLEKAINYVKFLQLQVKVLMNDEYWPKHDDDDGQSEEQQPAATSIGLAA